MANGLESVESKYSAEETVARIEAAARSKGLTIFTTVDHSGEAAKVGLTMPFARVIVFGSPKAGTPLMVAAPTLAIDLPLKALVQETDGGKVMVYWNAPEYLRDRHGVPQELVASIAGVGGLLKKAVE